ncbi:hypothetical protein PENANT_c023G03466 [Penicillium antarcticum]|uniref:Pyruvate decarboxylase n=1 Tax=Penicillium antarcticum TaxID=416450 RepID=A0A1V6Q035_9EURO|nr:hypothetical protein PENANT_c023G03466 [Penicillium antarcticum]
MSEITLGQYLFARLRQAGLNAVHAVPAQHHLEILNQAVSAGLEWTQHSSELNAGFTADGYGQIRGIAAPDAISESYEEMVPVVLVIGSPPRMEQFQAFKYHHPFYDTQPEALEQFANWFPKSTVMQEILLDPNDIANQVDNAIKECIFQSWPVYIELPEDMVNMKIRIDELDAPTNLKPRFNNDDLEQKVLAEIMNRIRLAERPTILIDAGATTCGQREINRLAKMTGIPTTTTSISRGLVDETLSNFHGSMCSRWDKLGAYVQSSDFVLHIGPIETIFRSSPFDSGCKQDKTITFKWVSIIMGSKLWSVSSRFILQKILKSLSQERLQGPAPYPDLPNVQEKINILPIQKKTTPLQHDIYNSLWRRISSLLCPGDLILTEPFTAGAGARSFVLPRNAIVINSGFHRSPEYMLAATSGVAIAQRELGESKYLFGQGRTILFEGIEGFKQAQGAFGTVYKEKLNMIIFLINEKQQSVEKFMHEMEMKHNHGAPWKYSESLSFLGSPNETSYPVLIVELEIQPENLEVPGLFSGKYGESPSLLTKELSFVKD